MQALWRMHTDSIFQKVQWVLTKREMDKLRFCEAADTYSQHLAHSLMAYDAFICLNIPIKK